MHHTTSNLALHLPEPVSFAAEANASASVDLKQSPMPPISNAADVARPTILDKTKRQLIDAVSKNRLTIVIGPTG